MEPLLVTHRPRLDTHRGLELRDRYLERSTDPAARARLDAELATLDVAPVIELDGLGLSYHPSARYTTARMVEAARLDPEHRELFARPAPQLPELALAFVDPVEFSYRSFENILPLDRYFGGLELGFALDGRAPLGNGREGHGYRFSLAASDEVLAALRGLDGLNLYAQPLNASSRGGRRFIFHSAALSQALGEALRGALPKRWLKRFAHVNPVFRCNRFEPSDAPFKRHVDTPYYDRGRAQVSRYTVLIYLSGGASEAEGPPVLELGEDVELRELPAMSCVVFRQELPHAGAPFAEGRKVFLRTELIFELDEDEVVELPEVAALFAKACYLSGEATLRPELGARMHELYDRAALAHWSGDPGGAGPEPHFHKRFRGVEFVTNGHDYWFAKGHLELRECAALAILDLLNCKVGGEAFRRQVDSRALTPPADAPRAAWAFAQLERADAPGDASAEPRHDPLFAPLELEALLPAHESVDEDMCCPFHRMVGWDPSRHSEVVDLYVRAQHYVRRRLGAVPVKIMGEELFLDLDKFIVGAGKIHVLSEQALAPVNFAACWNDGSSPTNYVHVEGEVEGLHLLVPPLLFVEHARGYHLMADLFRNAWMVSEQRRVVPVPRIQEIGYDEDWEDACARAPWLEAASRGLLGAVALGDEDEDEQWWDWEDSPLAEELERAEPDDAREQLELFGQL